MWHELGTAVPELYSLFCFRPYAACSTTQMTGLCFKTGFAGVAASLVVTWEPNSNPVIRRSIPGLGRRSPQELRVL